MTDQIREAYDAEAFRQNGHRIIDMLADELGKSLSGIQAQTIPWTTYEESCSFWESFADDHPTLTDLTSEVLKRSIRISDPRFMGHQICTPATDAILAGLVSDFMNNGNGVFEMGIAGV